MYIVVILSEFSAMVHRAEEVLQQVKDLYQHDNGMKDKIKGGQTRVWASGCPLDTLYIAHNKKDSISEILTRRI